MNRRERALLIAAIVMLGAVVFKFLIYDPQQAQYATLVQAREVAAGELAREKQVLARADGVHREYNRLAAFVKTVEAKLPRDTEIPALLTRMEQFTRTLGIGLEGIRPGPLEPVVEAKAAGGASGTATAQKGAAKPLAYSRMTVSMTLTGTFAQTVEYLKELRRFPRLILVDTISLTPQKFPSLGVSLQTQIYTLGTRTPGR